MDVISSEKTLLASAARIATASGDGVDMSPYSEMVVFLNVSAVTGSPTSLDVKVEISPDNSAWFTCSSFTQVTSAVSKQALPVTCFGKWVRVTGTMVGGSEGNGYTYKVTAIGKAAR